MKQIREMEEETDRVTLHGMWASSYSKRVEMAVKIKGMPTRPGKIHQGFGPLILIKEPKSASGLVLSNNR